MTPPDEKFQRSVVAVRLDFIVVAIVLLFGFDFPTRRERLEDLRVGGGAVGILMPVNQLVEYDLPPVVASSVPLRVCELEPLAVRMNVKQNPNGGVTVVLRQ